MSDNIDETKNVDDPNDPNDLQEVNQPVISEPMVTAPETTESVQVFEGAPIPQVNQTLPAEGVEPVVEVAAEVPEPAAAADAAAEIEASIAPAETIDASISDDSSEIEADLKDSDNKRLKFGHLQKAQTLNRMSSVVLADSDKFQAEKHARSNALTVYDNVLDQYMFRSVWDTKREEIGTYGVGIQLYFELLYYLGWCFLVMSVLNLPVMMISYFGDFAGTTASYFAKTTIGNIGICGTYGELCTSYEDIIYRSLWDITDTALPSYITSHMQWILRDATMVFGILDGFSVLIILVLVIHFGRKIVKRVVKENDAEYVTAGDYAVQVKYLPKKLEEAAPAAGNGTEENGTISYEHTDYAELLKAHINGLLGPNAVAEVTLVRDYQRSVAVFIEIGEIKAEIRELRAQKIDADEKKIKKLDKMIDKKMKLFEKKKDALKSQREVLDIEKEIVTAYVILQTTEYRDKLIFDYRWAAFSSIFRFFQSKKFRFLSKYKITMVAAPEPSDVFHENLDLPKKEKFWRRLLTFCMSFIILIICSGAIIYVQHFKASLTSSTDDDSKIWVITRNTAGEDGSCFTACEIELFSDKYCSDTTILTTSTVFDSSGNIDSSRRLLDQMGISDSVSGSTASSVCSSTGLWYPSGQCKTVSSDSSSATGCTSDAIWAVIDSVIGCGDSFWTDVNCYYTALQSSVSPSIQSCSASIVDSTIGKDMYTVIEWIEILAEQETATSGLTSCSSTDLDSLLAASPACKTLTVIDGSQLFCECYSDIIGGSSSMFTAATTCDTYGSTVLGMLSLWAETHTVLSDRMKLACYDNTYVAETTEYRFWIQNLQDSYTFTSSTGSSTVSYLTTDVADSNSYKYTRVGVIGSDAATVASDFYTEATGVATAVDSVYTQVVPTCDSSTQTRCSVSRECISSSRVCDGIPDCAMTWTGYSSDETSTCVSDTANTETSSQTTKSKFLCSNGDYIEDVYWCDGVDDCSDGSDETGSTCSTLKSLRSSSGTPSSSEWVGFRLEDSDAVKCMKYATASIVQANNTANSILRLHHCDEGVVFRNGQVVLRDPFKMCRPVTTVGFDFSEYLDYTNIVYPTDWIRSYLYTAKQSGSNTECSSDDDCTLTNQACYAVTTEYSSTGYLCKFKKASVYNKAKLTYQSSSCPSNVPIAIATARAVYRSFTDSSTSVLDEKGLLSDLTYQCYCSQQLSYSITNDPSYLIPPYTSDSQVICKLYLEQQIIDKIIVVASIVSVSVLNFVLQHVMLYFAKYEKHESLSAKVFSEMRKLFLVLFVNTAVIVLIININLQSISSYTLIGLGNGNYSDFTSSWFVIVGAGFAVTIVVQTCTMTFMPLLTSSLMRVCRKRSARHIKTQEILNTAYEYPDFSLSMRLAQCTMIVFACLLYSSGVPFLNILAFFYFLVAYWVDKYVLLRYSKIPPQYNQDMVLFISNGMVFAVLLHSCFAIWMFSNQQVFPADFIATAVETWFNQNVDQELYYDYVTGDSSPETLADFGQYISWRIVDGLRKSSIGNLAVVVICIVYLSGDFIVARYRAMRQFFRKCFGIVSVDRSSSETREAAKLSFNDALPEMKRLRTLSSYAIGNNPNYQKAFKAITLLDKEAKQNRIFKSKTGTKVFGTSTSLPKVGTSANLESVAEDEQ
jgi:Calcium-dependent channel, 7TM region, putative phosphate